MTCVKKGHLLLGLCLLSFVSLSKDIFTLIWVSYTRINFPFLYPRIAIYFDKDKSKVQNIFLFIIFCYFFFMLDYGFIVLRSSMYPLKYLEWIVMGGSTTFVLNKGELHEGWWFLLCHDIICIFFTISTWLGIPTFDLKLRKLCYT